MLIVHRAERADRLIAPLTEVLLAAPNDPLTPEVVHPDRGCVWKRRRRDPRDDRASASAAVAVPEGWSLTLANRQPQAVFRHHLSLANLSGARRRLYLRCDRLVDHFLETFGQYFCRKSNNRSQGTS